MYTVNNPKNGSEAHVAMLPPLLLVLHGSNQTTSIPAAVNDFLFPKAKSKLQ
jgi:poly(3-hydroxybutyrate) depolymerase